MRFLLVFLLVLVLPAGLRAEPREIAASLTLEQVLDAVVRENPQLHSYRAKAAALAERPVQERSLPNPMFKYSGMDAIDRGSWPNTNEKRFEIEQEFPGFGKAKLRGKVAEKEAAMAGHESEVMERELIGMVKETYFDLYGVQRSLSITRTEADVLKRMAAIAETKYSTGTASQQDVLKAQAETTMLKQKLLELEQQEATLKAKLNQFLNRPANAPLGLAVSAPAAEFTADSAGLFELAGKSRHELQHAQTQVKRDELQRDLKQREARPDYRLRVEYRSFRDEPDQVMFTIGFDLPIWRSKYRASVREAEKMMESSQAALATAERQVSFDVQDAQFKWQTARRTLELYRGALIPQAEARFAASEAGYRTGKVDFLDLLESERFLLNARVMAAMAEGNVGMQLARLERAVGTELSNVKEKK
jgi:outer membrane protein, heavy metal efflux system